VITGVKIEFTKKAALAGDPVGTWRRAGGVVAAALAKRIRERVTKRGNLAGQAFSGYSGKHPRFVNPRYPIPGGEISGSGLKVYESSHVMHKRAGTRHGSFRVTGGMWGGLSVGVTGKSSVIRFRGKSHGQEVRTLIRKTKRFRGGARQGRVSLAKPSNALKAASIWRSLKINPLALSTYEVGAIAEGVAVASVRSIKQLGPAGVETVAAPLSGALQADIVRRLL
jgi:hypothetical protein